LAAASARSPRADKFIAALAASTPGTLAGPALGASWRSHYDRLHLHTVKGQSHLPGLPFAKQLPRYPLTVEALGLLKKTVPDLQAIEHSGKIEMECDLSAEPLAAAEWDRQYGADKPN